MVAAVRQGQSQRAVARQFGVSLRTVQHWLTRAGSRRLDRVDWSDQRTRARPAPNRTPAAVEDRLLEVRAQLAQSILGEAGAIAIQAAWGASTLPCPSVRTIGRILARRGAVAPPGRRRQLAPPPGWHLPRVHAGACELELFDFIEMRKLADGPLVDLFTGVALHAGTPMAVPVPRATTPTVLTSLTAHWQALGCPGYAQFDNDTRFQGAHQHRDVFGQVVRFCLHLGVIPVFVPPREFGLQNPIEAFNGLWERKVWARFHFPTLAALTTHTAAYVAARRARLAARLATAPPRHPWAPPAPWTPTRLPAGTVIYIRRTGERGTISLLGHTWPVDRHWCHRLVRAEVDLRRAEVRCYALQRRHPTEQPLLTTLPDRYPRTDLAVAPESAGDVTKRTPK